MSMILRVLSCTSLLALAFTYAPSAAAGPNDTLLPFFSDAKPALHVYTAVGVIKNNNLETVFICNNVDTSPVNIGIEIFNQPGTLQNNINDPNFSLQGGNGQIVNVAVGETVTFGTSGIATLHVDHKLRALGPIRNGSGRVIGSTKNISCTAILLDEIHAIEDPLLSGDPPPMMMNLPLIRLP